MFLAAASGDRELPGFPAAAVSTAAIAGHVHYWRVNWQGNPASQAGEYRSPCGVGGQFERVAIAVQTNKTHDGLLFVFE